MSGVPPCGAKQLVASCTQPAPVRPTTARALRPGAESSVTRKAPPAACSKPLLTRSAVGFFFACCMVTRLSLESPVSVNSFTPRGPSLAVTTVMHCPAIQKAGWCLGRFYRHSWHGRGILTGLRRLSGVRTFRTFRRVRSLNADVPRQVFRTECCGRWLCLYRRCGLAASLEPAAVKHQPPFRKQHWSKQHCGPCRSDGRADIPAAWATIASHWSRCMGCSSAAWAGCRADAQRARPCSITTAR